MKRLFLVLSALLLAPLTHAALDLNNDGIPDVWALVHGLGAIDMNQDSDGDGQTNAQEALWGTNPLSAAGTARITSITTDEYGVHLIFAGQAGKQYQVQSTTSLGGGWSNVGAVIHGSEGDTTANPEVTNADQKFYRVTVSDTDSDGDGVADSLDQCPGTPPGAIVNAEGCSLDQLVPCEGPWRNHGQYVSTIARISESFREQGLITERQRDDIISAAARSDCGDKRNPLR